MSKLISGFKQFGQEFVEYLSDTLVFLHILVVIINSVVLSVESNNLSRLIFLFILIITQFSYTYKTEKSREYRYLNIFLFTLLIGVFFAFLFTTWKLSDLATVSLILGFSIPLIIALCLFVKKLFSYKPSSDWLRDLVSIIVFYLIITVVIVYLFAIVLSISPVITNEQAELESFDYIIVSACNYYSCPIPSYGWSDYQNIVLAIQDVLFHLVNLFIIGPPVKRFFSTLWKSRKK